MIRRLPRQWSASLIRLLAAERYFPYAIYGYEAAAVRARIYAMPAAGDHARLREERA